MLEFMTFYFLGPVFCPCLVSVLYVVYFRLGHMFMNWVLFRSVGPYSSHRRISPCSPFSSSVLSLPGYNLRREWIHYGRWSFGVTRLHLILTETFCEVPSTSSDSPYDFVFHSTPIISDFLATGHRLVSHSPSSPSTTGPQPSWPNQGRDDEGPCLV